MRFEADGHWAQAPVNWDTASPEQLLTGEELADCLEGTLEDMPRMQKAVEAQARDLVKPGRCLVLADLRPRNVYVNNGQLYLVDFATAHFGQPSFDLGFYASDLCLKAMLNHPQKAAYLEAINVFWMAYFRIGEHPKSAEVEKAAVRDFGCLLLAQVAGRLPVVAGDDAFQDLAYRIGQSLLFTELGKIEDITEFINRTLIDG